MVKGSAEKDSRTEENGVSEPGAAPLEGRAAELESSMSAQIRMLEAMLFATSTPLSLAQMASHMPPNCNLEKALKALQRAYQGRGVELKCVGGAWALRTAPDLRHLIRAQVHNPRKLSPAAREVLAVIAYHQPVTRAEIEEMRGVTLSPSTINFLVKIGWVRLGRRRLSPGRPVTFVATDACLDHFGLESWQDLPSFAELDGARE